MKVSQEYLAYSDNPEQLTKILDEVTIYLNGSCVRVKSNKGNRGNRVWNVRVERKGKSIEFEFHNSIHELDMEEKTVQGLGGKIIKTGKYRNSNYTGVVEKAV